MGTLANIGGGTGQCVDHEILSFKNSSSKTMWCCRRNYPSLLVEGRELILGDWVEEMAASVVGVHRAPAFLRHCFVEQPYYHTSEDPGGDDSGEWCAASKSFRY